jgi:hypothetical protein
MVRNANEKRAPFGSPLLLVHEGARLDWELAEEIDGHLQRHIEDNLERL